MTANWKSCSWWTWTVECTYFILPPYCWSSWQTKASRWLKDTLSPSQIYLSCLSRPLAVYSLYGKNLCDASFLFYFRSLSWPNLDFKAWLRALGPQSANRVLVCDSDACSSTSTSPKTGPWIPRPYLAHRDDTDLLDLLFFLLVGLGPQLASCCSLSTLWPSWGPFPFSDLLF